MGMALVLALLGAGAPSSAAAPATPDVARSDVTVRAMPGFEIVSTRLTVVPNGQPVTAICPQGKFVLGGGVFLFSGKYLLRSAPTFDRRGWQGAGTDPTGGNVGVGVQVLCGFPPPGYRIISSSVNVDVPANKRLQVSCPAGTVGLSVGGLVAGPDPKIGLSALYFDKNTDGTYRANTAFSQRSSTVSNQMETIALCSAAPAGYQFDVLPTQSQVPNGQLRYPACPEGKTSLHAGMSIPGNGYISDISVATTAEFWELGGFNPSYTTYGYTPSIICVS